jgi:hypothetical protein
LMEYCIVLTSLSCVYVSIIHTSKVRD